MNIWHEICDTNCQFLRDKLSVNLYIVDLDGADGGGRTHTLSRVPDFESGASASSATSATVCQYISSGGEVNKFPHARCGVPFRARRDGKCWMHHADRLKAGHRTVAAPPIAPKGNRVTARRDTPAFRMFPSPLGHGRLDCAGCRLQ